MTPTTERLTEDKAAVASTLSAFKATARAHDAIIDRIDPARIKTLEDGADALLSIHREKIARESCYPAPRPVPVKSAFSAGVAAPAARAEEDRHG